MGDDVPLTGLMGLLFFLLLLSAFFSGSETALMSLNRYQLRHKAREGHRGARLAERLLKRPDRVIGLILLGNNLVNFSMASLVGIITFKIGGEPAAAVGTIAQPASSAPSRRRSAPRASALWCRTQQPAPRQS